MTIGEFLASAELELKRCFIADETYQKYIRDLTKAYEAGRNQNLEEWKVLEKNYDDLYERTRWHFPAKGELPEDCSRVLAIEKERSECRAGLYDFLKSEEGDGLWEWLPRRIAVLSNDQILAWQYLPEEPKEEANDSKEIN